MPPRENARGDDYVYGCPQNRYPKDSMEHRQYYNEWQLIAVEDDIARMEYQKLEQSGKLPF